LVHRFDTTTHGLQCKKGALLKVGERIFAAGLLFSAIGLAIPIDNVEAQPTGTLRIVVSDVRAARGHVHVAVCPQAVFLKDACVYKAIVPAKQGQTIATIDGMPAGTYAAQVYFDENDNDELDRSFIGIPEEGVGFSNNPSFAFRAPTFADTAFSYDGVSGSITVRLRYY
jgi:uncharacterized protein (DUF2141 family)